jgi:hypothetical protein
MKETKIGGQDICAHWQVTSCAFMGGNVQGNRQYGAVGEKTLHAVPLMPDGSLDPNFDPVSGELLPNKKKHPKSSVPNHGSVYATALHLSGIDPKDKGRNERAPLGYIARV